MLPNLEIFGRSVPSYWLCALLGFSACGLVAFFRHKHFKDLKQVDVTNAAAFLLIGVIIGGRILSIITMIPFIIRNWDVIRGHWSLIYEILSNGMVFYGGLFGAILAVHIYCKHYQLDRKAFFDYLVPLFPLFHVFGRIGCFLTGCCHGQVSYSCGIAYTHSISSENGIPYFPIQLVCSALNFLFFFLISHFERKHHREGKALSFYLIVYAAGRFIIEFFRGDEIRGFVLCFSTSQWISLIILTYFLIKLLRGGRHESA